MSRKLYVGNLSFDATEESVREKFSECGTVDSVNLIKDRDSGANRGFGFVEMSTNAEAQTAMQTLDGSTLSGQTIKVSQAKEKAPRGGGDYGRRRRW